MRGVNTRTFSLPRYYSRRYDNETDFAIIFQLGFNLEKQNRFETTTQSTLTQLEKIWPSWPFACADHQFDIIYIISLNIELVYFKAIVSLGKTLGPTPIKKTIEAYIDIA